MTVQTSSRRSWLLGAASLAATGYKPVLAIAEDAWDIFMIYGTDARWDAEAPPKPLCPASVATEPASGVDVQATANTMSIT